MTTKQEDQNLYYPETKMTRVLKIAIEDHLEQLKYIQAKLFDHLLHAQAKYKKVADRHRLDSTLEKLKFQIGGRV